MKKPKIPAIVIASRDAMTATVNAIVTAKVRYAEITSQMEQEIIAVQERYREPLAALGREIQSKEAGVQLYCEQHRSAEFAGKKSIDLALATIGFRETPYRVEKARTKDTWEEIAARMAGITATDDEGRTVFRRRELCDLCGAHARKGGAAAGSGQHPGNGAQGRRHPVCLR